MIRCSCGNELVSVEAICEQCDVPVVTWPRYAAIAECIKCGEPVEQPRPGRSTSECLCCGVVYGLDFFRKKEAMRGDFDEDELDDENADCESHLLEGDDCGMNPQGDCGKAGSEECEFGCPYGRVKRN